MNYLSVINDANYIILYCCSPKYIVYVVKNYQVYDLSSEEYIHKENSKFDLVERRPQVSVFFNVFS